MNIFKIKASSWEEDDFILATQLTEKQVRSVIQPMVDEERESDFVFNNADYLQCLRDAYPKSVILSDLEDLDSLIF